MLFALLMLPGCAVLGDKRVAAGCQALDGVTSYYALKHGATEVNPLLAGASPNWLLAFKLAFAYVIWKAMPSYDDAMGSQRFATGAVTVLGCVPAVNNIQVIRAMP